MFGVNSHVARCLLCAKSYGNEGKVNDKCETMRDGETSVTLCESEAFSLSCFFNCETETLKCFKRERKIFRH